MYKPITVVCNHVCLFLVLPSSSVSLPLCCSLQAGPEEVESRVRDLLLAVDTDHYTLPQRKSEMVREVMLMIHVYWLKVSVK